MPIVIAFRNENLKDNHWVEIKDLIGQEFDVDEDEFSLNSILNLNATQFKEEIQIISTQASAEASLKTQLQNLDETWEKIDFVTKIYKEGLKDTTFILDEVDDVFQTLDESLAAVNTILSSRFVKPVRMEAETWKKHLMLMSKILENWI